MEAAQRPHRSTSGLRYDLMKTDAPPVRNPDAQLAAADIDTSRLDADTNNWGPRLGMAWSPPGGTFAVRGGWGLFYGRTPSIMLGTAHSNNGINIVSLTFTGDAVPTYPQQLRSDSGRRRRGAAEHLLHRQGLRQRAADAGQRRRRMGDPCANTSLAVTYLFVDGEQLPRSIDRNLGTRRRADVHRRRVGRRRFRIRSSAPIGRSRTSQRVIAFESTAESRYNGLTLELNRRFAGSPPVPRRLHARQGRGHRARRDGGRPRQRRRRREVRVEPGGLRRRSDRRQQRPAPSLRR